MEDGVPKVQAKSTTYFDVPTSDAPGRVPAYFVDIHRAHTAITTGSTEHAGILGKTRPLLAVQVSKLCADAIATLGKSRQPVQYLLDFFGREVELFLGREAHPLCHPHTVCPAVEITPVHLQKLGAQSQVLQECHPETFVNAEVGGSLLTGRISFGLPCPSALASSMIRNEYTGRVEIFTGGIGGARQTRWRRQTITKKLRKYERRVAFARPSACVVLSHLPPSKSSPFSKAHLW